MSPNYCIFTVNTFFYVVKQKFQKEPQALNWSRKKKEEKLEEQIKGLLVGSLPVVCQSDAQVGEETRENKFLSHFWPFYVFRINYSRPLYR